MAKSTAKCPECGHEVALETTWSVKDWVLYLIAVVPIGLMALALAGVAVLAALRMLG